MSLPNLHRIARVSLVSSLLTLVSLVAFPFVTAAAPLVSDTVPHAFPSHESITRVSAPAEPAHQSVGGSDSVIAPNGAEPAAHATGSPEAQSILMVNLARRDLAEQLGVPVGQIEVSGVTPVQWPDSSLGSPGPGRLYSSVVTPGYLIVLQVNGQSYTYHTDTDNQVVYCPTS